MPLKYKFFADNNIITKDAKQYPVQLTFSDKFENILLGKSLLWFSLNVPRLKFVIFPPPGLVFLLMMYSVQLRLSVN